MAQMQAYGISHEETLSRVDSLIDKEIASIAGKMDQISKVGGDNYKLDGNLLSIVGLAIYAIVHRVYSYLKYSWRGHNPAVCNNLQNV